MMNAPKRYLVFIHLTSTVPIEKKIPELQKINENVRAHLTESYAFYTTDRALGFAGLSSKPMSELYESMAKGMFRGDDLTIFEIGGKIASAHQGIMSWHSNTMFIDLHQ
jgi:hypothetical protein